MYKLHKSCRACGHGTPGTPGTKHGDITKLVPVFSLGVQPLANSFCDASEEQDGYAPLEVLYCPKCTLAQLSVVVDPKILYSHYLYVTNPTEAMRKHFDVLHDLINKEQDCNSLLEIGSNDGRLLKHFAGKNVKVVGIDPAANLTDISRRLGITTITGLFDRSTAQESLAACREGFDAILARHVFCHVDDWAGFIESLSVASRSDTLVCIEVPYAKDLIQDCEFDTIYHEHLSYLTIRSVEALLRQSDFRLHRIIPLSIHGGALLLMLRHKKHRSQPHSSVEDYLNSELLDLDAWAQFKERSNRLIENVRNFVRGETAQGKRCCGVGASAKSTVWINACGFTRKDIGFITDITEQKLWKLSPGSGIPVVDEGALLRELPDYAICFAWNWREELLQRHKLAREKGVKFVFPIPHLDVV